MNAVELRACLKAKIPAIWFEIDDISQEWTKQVVANLKHYRLITPRFLRLHRSDSRPIELFEWEVALLDSPLLQRLRGVRQLGMAHALYAGATMSASATLGVVEVAERMIRALDKNAEYHRKFEEIEIPTSRP
jgi:hypothetical protein